MYRDFDIERVPDKAFLFGLADFSRAVVYVNGTRLATQEPYSQPFDIECRNALRVGKNRIGVCLAAVDGPSAFFAELTISHAGTRKRLVVSNPSWKAAALHQAGLEWPQKLTSDRNARSLGPVAKLPWGDREDRLSISPIEDYTQWKRAENTSTATDPATFDIPAGYELELLRKATTNEGSWVGMAFDPQGRLIVAKETQGLLRLTLPGLSSNQGAEVVVETVNDALQECRGLLFAHGQLYAMANNDKALYALQPNDSPEGFGRIRELARFPGEVGHGRNEITLAEDGQLLAIFGDAVHEPEGAAHAIPPLATPSSAESTRSGYVARIDPSTAAIKVVARGLRNPFGIAVNEHGDIFTYDADAEYDMGAPWYRPTRIDHVVSGGDFGWRRVTRQWPPYHPDRPDMPQPVLDIGKGSPTAVTFGYASDFPEPYRRALFVADWAYGRILAVHLTSRGSGYGGKAETFLQGRPANVTDLEFGPDGGLYFVTGGRGTQSALYRLRYTGGEQHQDVPVKSRQSAAREEHAAGARRARKRLERFHGHQEPEAVAEAWPHLGSDDPWLRHAARVAIESQRLEKWQRQAFNESDSRTLIEALLALVRVGPASLHPRIVERLASLRLDEHGEERMLAALYIYERTLQSGSLNDAGRSALTAKLSQYYPHPSRAVNRQLSLMLQDLDCEDFVSRTVPLLENADDQAEQLHYLFVLRNAESGWTPSLRRRFFEQFTETETYVGGDGMPTFLNRIREESLASVPAANRQQYQTLLDTSISASLLAEIPESPRPLVKDWELSDFSDALDHPTPGRNYETGKQVFAAARCVLCHRCGVSGGVVGPDLTSVARRFSHRDLLTAILDPSSNVAEKYQTHQFVLADGRVIEGQILPGGDYRSPTLRVITDPLQPAEVSEIEKAEIEHSQQQSLSPMPEGLLDSFTRNEILDLLAFLAAGGERSHPLFSK